MKLRLRNLYVIEHSLIKSLPNFTLYPHLQKFLIFLVQEEPPDPLRVCLRPLLSYPPDSLDRLKGLIDHGHQAAGGRGVGGEQDLASYERL